MRLFLLLPLVLLLSACSLLSGGGPAPDLYTLSPATRFAQGLPKTSWQIMVEEPSAVGGLDANRVAVQATLNEIRYFGDIRWVERAPRMVQGLLVESFERSGTVTSADRYTIGPRADYVLKSELRDFQAELFETPKTPKVHVRLAVKLVRGPRQDIVWTRDFAAVATATASTAPDVVAAFDQALGQVMADIVAVTAMTPPAR